VPDASDFLHPTTEWQRRYEALRASFVERLPARVVGERFGYAPGYVHLLRHLFRHGKIDFSEVPPPGRRSRVPTAVRTKICAWRGQRLSAGEIARLLCDEGAEISVRTVERVLAEEGFPKLPRRLRLKVGLTVKGASVPESSRAVTLADLDGQSFESAAAGVFLFAPFLSQLGIVDVVRDAGLPGSEVIPASHYLLSLLALKLLGAGRYAHVGDHAFDPGLGLFAGLNVLPTCTAYSTYSCSVDAVHIQRLQAAFVKRAAKLGLYEGRVINLDVHTVPHDGDESVLDRHWAGARGKVMKGVLTLFAQDADAKLLLYTAADIQRSEADDQVTEFLTFWRHVRRGVAPTLVFNSRFTTYPTLSALNRAHVRFITLRRRGHSLLQRVDQLDGWTRIHIPHEKRTFPNPDVHESTITLPHYEGAVRQVIVRGNGQEKPALLISNDFESPVERLVGQYARRWRVEHGIAEAVKFFHLNTLSSPILTRVHFDVALTMIADTLYTMLARRLRGFEDSDAPKLCRHVVDGKGRIDIRGSRVEVTYPRRAHNPILRNVAWDTLPQRIPLPADAELSLRFL